MKQDFKKLALCSLIAGLMCISAQDVSSEDELMNSQTDCTEEIAMGRSDECPPRPEECPSKCDGYDLTKRECKKACKRRGVAKEAMDD